MFLTLNVSLLSTALPLKALYHFRYSSINPPSPNQMHAIDNLKVDRLETALPGEKIQHRYQRLIDDPILQLMVISVPQPQVNAIAGQRAPNRDQVGERNDRVSLHGNPLSQLIDRRP